jgi:acetyl-CoA carboxylase carboxyltransferase component
MKMQHAVTAPCDGIVRDLRAGLGNTVGSGQTLMTLVAEALAAADADHTAQIDLDTIRPDLAEVHDRHHRLTDGARPAAVARRHDRGARTARENIDDLCDLGTFTEYGGLTIAAQRRRHPHDRLVELSPADGMIAGFGSVNGRLFPQAQANCAILSYDYTVMAGTQGALNHKKKDRLLELTDRARLPLVIFAEGGGGRPGDVDMRLGLDVPTFARFARLKDRVPIISVVAGYCFAGNAALAGCADVLIATENASIGMGGPAMIEGGGLGTFHPRDVGPIDVQTRNGLVDIQVGDEAEAVDAARRVLSYFQGRTYDFEFADQRMLRHLVPENRKRVFSTRRVIDTLCDSGSVQELKRAFGPAIITAFVRIGGHPLGLVANDNGVLSGAIDADAAAKAADFLRLCEVRRLPVLSLCDTPGFMVGPETERRGQVRSACRLFVAGAKLTVPFFSVVLRKAYGLGAQAMAGGHFHAPFFSVAWPTGEFGAMGLEGAVELGFRKELEAFTDDAEKAAFFQEKLAEYYEHGRALTVAEFMEIDDVIDPADTRDWILNGLRSSNFIK